MSQIISKQAQHVKALDVIIYDWDVYTVENEYWTDDGLVALTIRKAGSFSTKTIEVCHRVQIETLEL